MSRTLSARKSGEQSVGFDFPASTAFEGTLEGSQDGGYLPVHHCQPGKAAAHLGLTAGRMPPQQ